jgi:cadmium resistance protein CadD (predicted permease)
MNVKLIRMSSGEDVVAELLEERGRDSIVIQNAIVAVPAGGNQLAFAPWSPILSQSSKELVVSKNFVVYIADVEEGVIENYEKMFSPIVKPSKKLIV